MPLQLKITYAQGTHLDTDLRFRFVSGRAICPDGRTRALKRIDPEAAELVHGQSIRVAVEFKGKTITGSLILQRPNMDEPTGYPLEFTPDPTGRNAHLFDSKVA